MTSEPETNATIPFECNLRDIKIQIDDKILTYSGKVFNDLLLQPGSKIACAIDFYGSQSRKPIDLTDAPFASRFKELIEILKKRCDDQDTSLCTAKKPSELLVLADYLGMLKTDTLDIMTLKCFRKVKENRDKRSQRITQLIESIVQTILNHFMSLDLEEDEYNYTFKFDGESITVDFEYEYLTSYYMIIDSNLLFEKIKNALFPRLKAIIGSEPSFIDEIWNEKTVYFKVYGDF